MRLRQIIGEVATEGATSAGNVAISGKSSTRIWRNTT